MNALSHATSRDFPHSLRALYVRPRIRKMPVSELAGIFSKFEQFLGSLSDNLNVSYTFYLGMYEKFPEFSGIGTTFPKLAFF